MGVFVSFTISQSGMVVHWLKVKGARWRSRLGINALGAVMTFVVLVVVLVSKAPYSLLVAVIIPILVGMMLFIERQYATLGRAAGGQAGRRVRSAPTPRAGGRAGART